MQSLRERVASALIYPILILATAALSLTFILTYVLPQFRPLFAEAGANLPLPPRVVMAIGDAIGHWGWAMAGVVALLAAGFRRRLQDPMARRFWHGKFLQAPGIGGLIAAIEAARFSRTLGTLVTAGVALPSAVGMATAAVGNAAIAEPLAEMVPEIRAGAALGDMIRRTGVLPSLSYQLIQVGEESGRLGDMLLRQAAMFEEEVERTVTRLLAALVPALTIVLGILVAGIISSILMAVLQINTLAQ
jgi:general secretion pathway protein F